MNALLVVALFAELQIGDPARALDLPTLEGNIVKTESLRGKPLVVDFFATWCGPCHEAMAALDEIVRQTGVQLVIVDVAEDAERVRAFFAAHPPPPGARVVLDRDGGASRRWGQNRYPTTFLVDSAGVVRHINRGYGSGYPARVGRWVRELR
jgi:thiol-disulfide isomerase/thioredoxin